MFQIASLGGVDAAALAFRGTWSIAAKCGVDSGAGAFGGTAAAAVIRVWVL